MITERSINKRITALFDERGKGEELGFNRKSWYQYKQQFTAGKLSLGKKLEILNAAGLLKLQKQAEPVKPLGTGGVSRIYWADIDQFDALSPDSVNNSGDNVKDQRSGRP